MKRLHHFSKLSLLLSGLVIATGLSGCFDGTKKQKNAPLAMGSSSSSLTQVSGKSCGADAFSKKVWPKFTQNCSSCHGNGGSGAGHFAIPSDSSQSYREALSRLNLSAPAQSLFVKKTGGVSHYGCSVCSTSAWAADLKSALADWASSEKSGSCGSSSGGGGGDGSNPTTPDSGDSGGNSGSSCGNLYFAQKVHPVLTQNCASCHGNGGARPQFAQQDSSFALPIALARVSLSSPSDSLIAKNGGTSGHGDGNCTACGSSLGQTLVSLITDWASAQKGIASVCSTLDQSGSGSTGTDTGTGSSTTTTQVNLRALSFFSSRVHPILKTNCSQCHTLGSDRLAAFAPFAVDDLERAYSEARQRVRFDSPTASALYDRATTAGHGPGCTGCGPSLGSVIYGLINEWKSIDDGTSQARKVVLKALPVQATDTVRTLQWTLPADVSGSDHDSNLNGAVFSIDVKNFYPIPGNTQIAVYQFSNPRMTTSLDQANAPALLVDSILPVLNGTENPLASTYGSGSVQAIVQPYEFLGSILSTSALNVSRGSNPSQDTIAFSFAVLEKANLTTTTNLWAFPDGLSSSGWFDMSPAVALLHFDRWTSSGALANFLGDSASGTNPGTCLLGPCPTPIAGKLQTGARFDGTQYLTLTQAPALNPLGSWSYSFWVKLDSYKAGSISGRTGTYLLDRKHPGTSQSSAAIPLIALKIVSNSSGKPAYGFQVRYDDNSTGTQGIIGGVPQVGTWQHIVLTRAVSEKLFKLYVNGTLAGTLASDPNKSLTAYNSLLGGMFNGGTSVIGLMQGAMDEFAIFNAALSPSAVQLIYQKQAPRFAAP